MTALSITRSARTTADPSAVLPLIHDFRQWQRWSPWEGLDPDLQRTYSGAETGEGSVYAWSGNKKAGAGTMRMVEADDRGARIALEFTKPFKATNEVRIDVEPRTDGGSDLSWTMTGEQNLVNRLFFKLFSMEKALSKDFDKGLAQLSVAAEARDSE